MAQYRGHIHFDIGSGDARGPYRWARGASEWLFVASDANPDALLETASRAARKPSRGGLPNLLCIGEPLQVVADELAAVADRVTVILPWGDLLRGVALPDVTCLAHLRRLCASSATLEVVFSYDQRDAGDRGPLGHIEIDEFHVRSVLPELYEAAGFQMVSAGHISRDELRPYATTWAQRLAFGQPRKIWRLRGKMGS